jgi:integrase
VEFRKQVRALDIKYAGATFYRLRRTFRTIADEAGDQPATVFIMGHADDDADMADMSATYR